MKKSLLAIVCLLAVSGCYRDPADSGAVSNVPPPSAPDMTGAAPNDSIHAGMAGGGPANAGAIIEERDVQLGSMFLTAPDEWVRRQPSSGFLMTEFTLPKAEGDTEDGRLTVSMAGGSVDANVDRWKSQFGGAPEKSTQETVEIAGLQVTMVDLSGTFADQRGAFAPATQKPGYRMVAAIIPLDGRMFFIKGYGPIKTIEAQADKFQAFVRSLKPVGAAPAEPAKTVDPPAEPAKTVDPPAEPAKTVDPPAEPAKTVDPPAEPAKTVDPPAEPAKTVDPPASDDPGDGQ